MRIVFTDSKTVASNRAELEILNEFGKVVLYDMTSPEELPERIKEADIALCNKTIFSAEAMSQAPRLQYIGLFATGYNNVDVDYAAKHNITVCNAGRYSTEAVA
ncbi:MAG: D-2-hydroxyacid dehydrogenase, partial [Clostridia bacterium]|nr:D-2-hydroxyacid dehydrogenase [Clostridia bacterium]